MVRDIDDHLQTKLRKARQEAEAAHVNAQKRLEAASSAMQQAYEARQQASEAVAAAEKKHAQVKRAEGLRASSTGAAWVALEGAKLSYRSAKRDAGSAKQEFAKAKDALQGSERKLKKAKDLEMMSRESPHELKELRDKVEADRELAMKAGVPARYLHNIKVVRKPDGKVHVYFSSKGSPCRPGHGRIIMDSDYTVTLSHDPRPGC